MTRRSRRLWERGQGLVEFALVFPVFILLLLGLLDLGRAVYAYNTIGDAAREGARVAIVNQIQTSPDCILDRPIVNPADPHWSIKACAIRWGNALDLQDSDVDVHFDSPPGITDLVCTDTIGSVGCIARVTVNYSWHAITPVIGALVGDIAMSSTSQVPVERKFP